MSSIFQHSAESPFHISVGAVVVSPEGKILTHHYQRSTIPQEYIGNLGGLEEAYILMRESLEEGETLEQAVARGIAEEFGVEGELRKYLGSIRIDIEAELGDFEKTTLYFEVTQTKMHERPADDEESFSELVWMEPTALIERMRYQGTHATRTDLDESKIIESYVQYR